MNIKNCVLDRGVDIVISRAAILSALSTLDVHYIHHCRQPGLTGHGFLLAAISSKGSLEPSGFLTLERVGGKRDSNWWQLGSLPAVDRMSMTKTMASPLKATQSYIISTMECAPLSRPDHLDLLVLAQSIREVCPRYTLLGSNCLWFSSCLLGCLKILFDGAEIQRDNYSWASTLPLIKLTAFEDESITIAPGHAEAKQRIMDKIAAARALGPAQEADSSPQERADRLERELAAAKARNLELEEIIRVMKMEQAKKEKGKESEGMDDGDDDVSQR
ncbi:hypothetical protein DFH09DRAFT_443197 [Mycena vulgaris]|nr:hypothetical protein DFH09DRAFT_443197 [Mycena vulgaris]